MPDTSILEPAEELRAFCGKRRFATLLADPPWQFINRTGKVAPEHRRLSRYGTMHLDAICGLPVTEIVASTAHLYLWVPNALLPQGLQVMQAWGFEYKSNIVWHKIRKDGGPDGRGVGFYFRNVTEIVLFGVRGRNARTLPPGRSQVNFLATRKREHSRKPDELYPLIEACSPAPRLELFARGVREGWSNWGHQADPTMSRHGTPMPTTRLPKGVGDMPRFSCRRISLQASSSSPEPAERETPARLFLPLLLSLAALTANAAAKAAGAIIDVELRCDRESEDGTAATASAL